MSDSETFNDVPELTEEQEEFHHKEVAFQQRIKLLEEENIQMKTQISQVEVYANKLEKLQGDHLALKRENGELLNKVADLEHRLEFVNEDKKEIEEELQKEREHNQNARSEEYQSMSENMDKKKAEFENQIQKLKEIIKERDNEIANNNVQAKLFNSKKDRLLQSAERYFEDSLPNIDDLIKRLEQPPAQPQPTPSPVKAASPKRAVTTPQRVQQQSDINEALLKRLKQKNRSLKTKYLDLAEECETKDEENKKQVHAYEKEIKTLKNQISATKEQNDIERSRMARQINQLQGQVDSLSEMKTRNQTEIIAPMTRGLASLAEQPKFASVVSKKEEEEEQNSVVQQIQEKQAKQIESLQKEVNDRLLQSEEQLKNAAEKEEALNNSLKSMKDEKDAMASENSALKIKIDMLITLNGEMENQIQNLRNVLHAKEPVEEQQPKQMPKQPNYKANIKKLQEEIEDLNKKIFEQQHDINTKDNSLQELNKKVRDETARADKAEEKVRSITMDLHESEEKIKKTPKLTPNDILPPDAFHSNGWTAELASSIDRIASNANLQPASKIQYIFGEIQSFYKNIVDGQQSDIAKLEDDAKEVREKTNEFLVNMSIALKDSSVTFDEFIKTEVGQEIIADISRIRNENDELRIANEQNISVINHIIDSFEFDNEYDPLSFKEQVDEIRERIELQTQQFEATIRKAKHYKRSLRDLEVNTKKVITEIKDENARLADENEELNEELTSVKTQLQESRDINESINAQMEETITQRDLSIINEKDQNEKEIESIHEEYTQREEQLQGEYHKVCDKLAEVSGALEAEENKSNELENELQTAQDAVREAQDMLEKAMEENKKSIQETEERHAAEKGVMKKEFDETIATLKTQYQAIQEDLESVAAQLSTSETKSKSLLRTVYKLKDYKANAVEEKKRLLSQMEREKLLSDAQARSKIMEEQAQMNEKMLEQQSKFEDDKNRIFNFFSTKFRKFCNPMKSTDEREFKACVERAYDEYSRLSTSDAAVRRMLNARDKQTTEDAVAQILVSKQ